MSGLCSWEFLRGLQSNLSFQSVFALYCQVLLKEGDESEKLVCSRDKSCFSGRNYSLMQCTKIDVEGKKVPLRLKLGTCHPCSFRGCAQGLLFQF